LSVFQKPWARKICTWTSVLKKLVTVLFLALSSASPSAVDIKQCQTLYTSAPKKLGGFPLTVGRNLEKQNRGDGFALQYGKQGKNWVNVHFYDGRCKKISDKFLLNEYLAATHTAMNTRLAQLSQGPANEIAQSIPLQIIQSGDFPGAVVYEGWIFFEPKGQPTTNDLVRWAPSRIA